MADFNGSFCLRHQAHQLVGKWDDKAVKIRPGDILKMAARANSQRQGIFDNAQILIHGLLSRQPHLVKNMVIRAGNENSRLFDAQILDQLKILFAGANPCGDFRELIAQILAEGQRFPILLCIHKKLALPNDAVFSPQAVHHLIEISNLRRRKGRHCLLPISESGICNPNFIRDIHGNQAVVEPRHGHLIIRENIPEQHRLFHILQRIFIVVFLKQIRTRILVFQSRTSILDKF